MLFKPKFEQLIRYPSLRHVHFSGHTVVSVTCWINNLTQNMTAGVANSSDSNTTVSLDGMASCCNLHREKDCSKILSRVLCGHGEG
jgi:hypothetical protein